MRFLIVLLAVTLWLAPAPALAAVSAPANVGAPLPPLIVIDLPAEYVADLAAIGEARLEPPRAGNPTRLLRATRPLPTRRRIAGPINVRLHVIGCDRRAYGGVPSPIRLRYQDDRGHFAEVAGTIDPRTGWLTARLPRVSSGR